MNSPQHGLTLIEILRPFALSVGEALPLDVIFESGVDRGFSLEKIEAAMIDASMKGWVTSVGTSLLLTMSGHSLLYPANDNIGS